MTIEAQLDRLNQNVERLLEIFQNEIISPLTEAASGPAQASPTATPPQVMAAPPVAPPAAPPVAQQAAPPAAPPMAASPAAAPPAQAAAPVTGAPAAPSAAPPADNVVPMQQPATDGPQMTREELNQELMAAVAKLGGDSAAASKVMALMTQKYKAASLQSLPENQYGALLADVRALAGG